MEFYPYICIFEHFLCFLLVNLSLIFSVKILFNRQILKKGASLSPPIIVYFIYVFIFGLVSNVNFAYLFAFFRPETPNNYDARILYFCGFLPAIFMTTNSVIEFFLCIDRCISIIFHVHYTRHQKLCFSIITFGGMIFASGVIIYLARYLDFIPTTSETQCRIFGCLLWGSKYTNVIKISLISSNIFAGIILATMIRCVFKNQNNLGCKRINKVVLITICTSTFIELPPFIVTHIFLAVSSKVET